MSECTGLWHMFFEVMNCKSGKGGDRLTEAEITCSGNIGNFCSGRIPSVVSLCVRVEKQLHRSQKAPGQIVRLYKAVGFSHGMVVRARFAYKNNFQE